MHDRRGEAAQRQPQQQPATRAAGRGDRRALRQRLLGILVGAVDGVEIAWRKNERHRQRDEQNDQEAPQQPGAELAEVVRRGPSGRPAPTSWCGGPLNRPTRGAILTLVGLRVRRWCRRGARGGPRPWCRCACSRASARGPRSRAARGSSGRRRRRRPQALGLGLEDAQRLARAAGEVGELGGTEHEHDDRQDDQPLETLRHADHGIDHGCHSVIPVGAGGRCFGYASESTPSSS